MALGMEGLQRTKKSKSSESGSSLVRQSMPLYEPTIVENRMMRWCRHGKSMKSNGNVKKPLSSASL